jgi:hypothetical protein
MLSSSNKVHKSIVLFFLLIPFYFKTDFIINIPLIGFIGLVFLILKKKTFNNKILLFIPYYFILLIFQYNYIEILNISAYTNKLMAIFIFIIILSFITSYYNKKYDVIIYYSFIITLIYGLYSSLSYILGYQQYLIPGTCGDNNLSPLGHLRCSTFGEGNYYGGYISLVALILYGQKWFLPLSLLAAFISFSPTPIFICIYLMLRSKIPGKFFLITLQISCAIVIFITFFNYYFLEFSLIKNIFGDSETSSFWERLEFIRSGFSMSFDNTLLGVGFGQFGYHLSSYSDYNHLINNANSGFRYIPNSNISEIISEQGLYGLVLYFYILYRLFNLNHPLLNRFELVIIFIFIGLTMPTLFQIVVAALLGVIIAKFSKRYI